MRKNILNDKRGQGTAVAIVILLGILVIGVIGGGWYYLSGKGTAQTIVGSTPQDIADATKKGEVASIGVYVRDISKDDTNTKMAVALYCQDDSGTFIIDGTTSSTTTETTGKSTIGKTVTCWAFNSTVQVLAPTVTVIDEEAEHILVDAFEVEVTSVGLDFYDSTFTKADFGEVNLSVSAGGSDSYQKMKFKNNNSNRWIPLGGFYADVDQTTNISNIDMSGSASLFGMDHGSTNLVSSSLGTKVSSRKSIFDYVFEFDDNPNEAGNQALILEESDYLETGSISVESNVGCTSGSPTATQMIFYGFTKGYYRQTLANGVGYGHETDALSSSVITADLDGTTVYCE